MPRIAHVISTPSDVGGAERVLEALVTAGVERGWEQRVLNPFVASERPTRLESLCPGGTYGARACPRLRDVPAVRRWLGRELDRFSPDIVHVHLFHALVLTASLHRSIDGELVLTHHHGDDSLHRSRLRARIDRVAGRRFDRVVAVSSAGRDFLLEEFGYPAELVELIPNGWRRGPTRDSGDAATSSGEEHPPTVICVARLRWQKGHDVLLRAFGAVVRAMPDARLVVVGDGEMLEQAMEQARLLGLSDNVRFTGQVDDVWPLLDDAEVFALAPQYEPLGIAVLEAMAAGLPVVATAVGGIPELVQPGITGELVPRGDDRAMADRLLELLRDGKLRRQMGAAGRAAAQGFTEETMVSRYFDLYARVRTPKCKKTTRSS